MHYLSCICIFKSLSGLSAYLELGEGCYCLVEVLEVGGGVLCPMNLRNIMQALSHKGTHEVVKNLPGLPAVCASTCKHLTSMGCI